jgi:hypothetical protein
VSKATFWIRDTCLLDMTSIKNLSDYFRVHLIPENVTEEKHFSSWNRQFKLLWSRLVW